MTLIPLLLSLVACNATLEGSASADDSPDALVLATYDVPTGYESRVEDVLNRVFWRGDEIPVIGRAHQGAPGSVIVAAPRSAHADVASIIDRLNKLDPKVAEPKNIRLDYWMVAGKRAETVDTSALPASIVPALSAVALAETPMRYTLVFQESLVSLDGARAMGAAGTATRLLTDAVLLCGCGHHARRPRGYDGCLRITRLNNTYPPQVEKVWIGVLQQVLKGIPPLRANEFRLRNP